MGPHVYHANPFSAGAREEVSNQKDGENVLVCIRAKTLARCQGPLAGCTLGYLSLTLVALFSGVSGMTGVYSASSCYARCGGLA